LTYVDQEGKQIHPAMLHRAILGSTERFIMILLEHLAGYLPVWLAPVQVWIIPITAKHNKYSKQVYSELSGFGFRVQLKNDSDSISKKIRKGEMQKIPYILVIGDKEIKSKSVSVRTKGKDLGKMKTSKFFDRIKLELEKKKQ